MLILCAEDVRVEAELAEGVLSCPSCDGRLRPWGYARARALRCAAGERSQRQRRRSWRPRRLLGAEVVAYAFSGSVDPVREGVLKIGELTTIVGPNDSGKSRLLRGFAAALSGGVLPRVAPSGEQTSAAIYARAPGELDDLLRSGTRNNSPPRPLPTGQDTPRQRWAARLLPDRPAAQRQPLEDALMESDLVAFTAANDGGWHCWWCLPPIGELKPRRAELAREHLHLAMGADPDIDVLARDGIEGPAPASMWQAGVPIAALYLGIAPLTILPAPRFVPGDVEEALLDGARLITFVLRYVRWGRAAREHLEDLARVIPEASNPADAQAAAREAIEQLDDLGVPHDVGQGWVTEEEGGRVVRREATVDTLSQRATAQATNALPQFVRDRYRLDIAPARIGSRGALLVARITELSSGNTHTLDEAADGLRLWLELAVRKGIDGIRDASAWLSIKERDLREFEDEIREHLEIHEDIYRGYKDLEEEGLADESEEQRGLYEAHSEYMQIPLGEIRDAMSELLTGLTAMEQGAQLPPGFVVPGALPSLTHPVPAPFASALRREFYLVDEPERHLHPRLQRAASRYLVNFTRQSAAQAAVITHSVAFMRSGSDDVSYVYVRRGSDATSKAITVKESELDALNHLTRELGLDRGELLAAITVVLFVEGRSDQYVIESLFRSQLRAAGIAIAPIHGIMRTKGIVEADLLMRYSDARLAFLIDDVRRAEIQEMLTDDTKLAEAAKSRKAEEQAIARLIQDARANGRHVQLFGIPTHDIFDLLDDDAIRTRFPKWPGHVAAGAKYQVATERKKVNRKDFYEAKYGIPKSERDTLRRDRRRNAWASTAAPCGGDRGP